ncbi:MAG: putative selenium-dependent hydroxylase accessory protein YqeC [Anaerolineales bacterium]|nr:putative selenium-dependent hydroxylase accessory protein YqeC [Anaerolineales bacterium]
MNHVQALRLSQTSTIAFVGAGGKTTAMFQLARELPPPVIVTATTHLGRWQIPLADEHVIVTKLDNLEQFKPRGVTLVTGEFEGERTKGLESNAIFWLREISERDKIPLLIEADGSRQKPLKAPAQHEPVIPEFVEQVVQVAGLSGLGKPLGEEFVHRPEIFARLSGLQPDEMISTESLAYVLTNPEGGLKHIPATARRVALLNQADTPELQSQARAMVKPLLSAYDAVIIASLQAGKIHAVHEPVAGIILAAGESQRYGQPKQLLDWRGEPFVRAVAKTALEAGLSPVIVVTGAHSSEVESAVNDLPVQVAHNPEWQSGQASSIRKGLSPHPPPRGALPQNQRFLGRAGEGAGGAIFLLADQPQVTPAILHALVEEHAATLSPIIAPLVLDQRANPVLFDRVTFPDLLTLEGDVGGRGIFSKHKINYLIWHDDALLLDVDTPEQYQRLKDLLE